MRYLLAIVLLLTASFAAAAPLVATVGDSIVATYSPSYYLPTHGWGQELPKYFDGVLSHNFAQSGQSSKTFLDQGLWTNTLAANPSFVLIMFGANDANINDPAKYTDPNTTFRTNLTTMVTTARAIGAEPIFVTPTPYRFFGADNKVIRDANDPYIAPYANAMKEVGTQLGVGVIDLYTSMCDLCDVLGPTQTNPILSYRNPPVTGPYDSLHYNEYGADQAAQMIVAQLPAASPALAAYVIPEPSTLAMLGGVAACCGMFRLRAIMKRKHRLKR